jgi:hypothetical protein
MIYYVIDRTLKPLRAWHFNSYPEIVKHLEGMCERIYGQTRKERMLILEELGHGADDRDSVVFVRSMAEGFDIGVVRDGQRTRCDISTIPLYQREEFGN